MVRPDTSSPQNREPETRPELAWRSINAIRALSMDAVEQAQSGHPGTPIERSLVQPRWRHLAAAGAQPDHGNPAVRIQDGVAAAPEQLEALARAGIDLAQVTGELEEEGVGKFAASYRSVLAAIDAKIGQLV